MRVAQHKTFLDDVMPEYQFSERHSIGVHATPKQVMQAVRESTFGDMRSLTTLLRVRQAALRIHERGELLRDKRIFDAFAASGFLSGGNEHEAVLYGASNARTHERPHVQTLEEFSAYGEPGGVKMAFGFNAEDLGDGWCVVTTETRVFALDRFTRRGMARYWRLIVPGSGLLRRQT
jgi:hypothetical protein